MLILAALLLIASIFAGNQYMEHRLTAEKTLSWSRCSGVIDTVRMTINKSHKQNQNHSYTPHIAYHFEQGGKNLVGHTISYPSPTFMRPEDAEAFVRKYPIGSSATVYFDAEAPDRNCLEQGSNDALISEFILVVVLICATFICLCLGIFLKVSGHGKA